MPSDEGDWILATEQLPLGTVIAGRVLSHRNFGFFLDVGFGDRFPGLVMVSWFRPATQPGPVTAADYPAIGSMVEGAVVVQHTDSLRQFRLSLLPEHGATWSGAE